MERIRINKLIKSLFFESKNREKTSFEKIKKGDIVTLSLTDINLFVVDKIFSTGSIIVVRLSDGFGELITQESHSYLYKLTNLNKSNNNINYGMF